MPGKIYPNAIANEKTNKPLVGEKKQVVNADAQKTIAPIFNGVNCKIAPETIVAKAAKVKIIGIIFT